MAISILASALLMAVQPAEAPAEPDFSGLLNAPDNAVRSCKIVQRADGPHLIIDMAKRGAGDAMLIDPDFGYKSYDYIFSSSGKSPRRFNISSSTLGKRDQIDIPLRTAMGLRADLMKIKVEPIFTQNGGYSIYIGYGFRNTDEAEIYGACYATLGVK
jgi:hypothetical protein